MEITSDLVKVQFRKLWSLYLCRMQLCKRLEKQAMSEEKLSFVKHFQRETLQFLREMGNFDWICGQNCLPSMPACKSLYDIDHQLLNTYYALQADSSWEDESPELSRFLMRNLGRVKASLQLLQHLYYPHFRYRIKNINV